MHLLRDHSNSWTYEGRSSSMHANVSGVNPAHQISYAVYPVSQGGCAKVMPRMGDVSSNTILIIGNGSSSSLNKPASNGSMPRNRFLGICLGKLLSFRT